jgi:hypothetical protein
MSRETTIRNLIYEIKTYLGRFREASADRSHVTTWPALEADNPHA